MSDGAWLVGECLAKHPLIRGVSCKGLQPAIGSIETELDRVLAVHRHECLVLETRNGRIPPREHGGIRDVHQTHTASRVRLPCRSDAAGTPIREGTLLFMTARAGLCPVAGETRVVEQVPPEFYSGGRDRIVSRDRWIRKAPWQTPVVRLLRRQQDTCGECDPRQNDRKEPAAAHRYFLRRTTSRRVSMRIDRAPRVSLGATIRNGP